MVLSIYLVGFAIKGEEGGKEEGKKEGRGLCRDLFNFFFIPFFYVELRHKVDRWTSGSDSGCTSGGWLVFFYSDIYGKFCGDFFKFIVVYIAFGVIQVQCPTLRAPDATSTDLQNASKYGSKPYSPRKKSQ